MPHTTPYILLCAAPGTRWNQNKPETITDALFTEPLQAVGTKGSPQTVRLGLTFPISYLYGPPDAIGESVRRLLALCEKHDTPVLLALDGQNWWGFRPDLWNWWDKTAPGYNAANREKRGMDGLGTRNGGKNLLAQLGPSNPRFASSQYRRPACA